MQKWQGAEQGREILCMQDLLFLKVDFYVVRVGRWDKKQYNPITLNDDQIIQLLLTMIQ